MTRFANIFPAKKVLLNFFQKIAGCRGRALTKKTFSIVFTASFWASPFERAFLFGSFSLRLRSSKKKNVQAVRCVFTGALFGKSRPHTPAKTLGGLVFCVAGLLCLNDTLCEHLSREKSFMVSGAPPWQRNRLAPSRRVCLRKLSKKSKTPF